jgi:hypothetical protein
VVRTGGAAGSAGAAGAAGSAGKGVGAGVAAGWQAEANPKARINTTNRKVRFMVLHPPKNGYSVEWLAPSPGQLICDSLPCKNEKKLKQCLTTCHIFA